MIIIDGGHTMGFEAINGVKRVTTGNEEVPTTNVTNRQSKYRKLLFGDCIQVGYAPNSVWSNYSNAGVTTSNGTAAARAQ